jgi:hypothetical protein
MNALRWAVPCFAAAAIVLFTQLPEGATMQTREDHAAARQIIHGAYRDARLRCADPSRRDGAVCMARAQAAYLRAEAVADVNYRGTVESKVGQRIVDAEADLLVGRVACEGKPLRQRNTCVDAARAANAGPAADAAEVALK